MGNNEEIAGMIWNRLHTGAPASVIVGEGTDERDFVDSLLESYRNEIVEDGLVTVCVDCREGEDALWLFKEGIARPLLEVAREYDDDLDDLEGDLDEADETDPVYDVIGQINDIIAGGGKRVFLVLYHFDDCFGRLDLEDADVTKFRNLADGMTVMITSRNDLKDMAMGKEGRTYFLNKITTFNYAE